MFESGRERLLAATESYAKALMGAWRMKDLELPVVEHQKVAVAKAGAALEAARPGSMQEFRSALEHDRTMIRSLKDLQGPERAKQLVSGMEWERQALLNPNVRAERFAAHWNKLEQEHSQLRGFEHEQAREALQQHMRAAVGALGRDPQMESVLRARQRELGIGERSHLGRSLRERDVSQALGERVERGLRERGQGYGMER